MPFVATWIDLEGMMLSEISQIEKDKYCLISLICGSLKTKQMNKYNKTSSEIQIHRTNKWLPEGRGWEEERNR